MPSGKTTSPYCSRCTKTNDGFRHLFHETNEHDDWWQTVLMDPEKYAKK